MKEEPKWRMWGINQKLQGMDSYTTSDHPDGGLGMRVIVSFKKEKKSINCEIKKKKWRWGVEQGNRSFAGSKASVHA